MPDRRHVSATRPLSRRPADAAVTLQGAIGNRAFGRALARTATRTGSVSIPGVGDVKVKGGNLEEWAGKGTPDTVELTSQAGKHSKKLEAFATARTRADVKVTIAPSSEAGENLNVGGGILLEIVGARVKGYSVADGVETWKLDDFESVKRTKITHTIGAG